MENEIALLAESYRSKRACYAFFDMNCWLPFTASDTFFQINDAGTLSDELGKFNIQKAIVTNAECLEYDPFAGNDSLVEKIRDYDNLYGCIVLTPEISFTGKDICGYLDEMTRNKIVAVRMFPGKFKHSVKKWQIGGILEYMQYKRLPLVLWHTEAGWDAIDEICEQYNELPVIVEGNDQKLLYHNRAFIPLVKRHGNLFLETHNCIYYRGMEYLSGVLGSDRLLFGTYFPYNAPDASIMMITHADVDEDIKHMIASRNINRLIKDIR